MPEVPTDQTLILHQYGVSPFSEKIRLIFGLKKLAWAAVECPVIMPKPDLTPLTGGYRKAPVLQIGAHIFCDTQLMAAEIERRNPARPLLPPRQRGAALAMGYWSDKAWFNATVTLVFGELGGTVPTAFIEDREAFSGRKFDLEQMKAALPYAMDQWRGHVALLNDQLSASGPYIFGEDPSLADASAFHIVWFLNNALPNRSEELLEPYPTVRTWFDTLKKTGHGSRSDIEPADALEIARSARPDTTLRIEDDAVGRLGGEHVTVTPDDTGRDPVVGRLIVSTATETAILREDDSVGEVMVHFPKIGFVISPV